MAAESPREWGRASCGARRFKQLHLRIVIYREQRTSPHWLEAEAMERGGTELPDGAAVLSGAVALVRGQAVGREDGVPGAHARVAIDLGDDGCGGDGVAAGVAFDEGALRQREIDGDGIHQQKIGRGGELADGLPHGQAGSLVDVDGDRKSVV